MKKIVCDICGGDEFVTRFKVYKHNVLFPLSGYERIDICGDCFYLIKEASINAKKDREVLNDG